MTLLLSSRATYMLTLCACLLCALVAWYAPEAITAAQTASTTPTSFSPLVLVQPANSNPFVQWDDEMLENDAVSLSGTAASSETWVELRIWCQDAHISRMRQSPSQESNDSHWEWSFTVPITKLCKGNNRLEIVGSSCADHTTDTCDARIVRTLRTQKAALSPFSTVFTTPAVSRFSAKDYSLPLSGIAGARVQSVRLIASCYTEEDICVDKLLFRPADQTGEWSWQIELESSKDQLVRGVQTFTATAYTCSTTHDNSPCAVSDHISVFSEKGYIGEDTVVLYEDIGGPRTSNELYLGNRVIQRYMFDDSIPLRGSASNSIDTLGIRVQCGGFRKDPIVYDQVVRRADAKVQDRHSWDWSVELSVDQGDVCPGANWIILYSKPEGEMFERRFGWYLYLSDVFRRE